MPPAARITDMHVCPLVTGVVPHVGGPILPPCEPTVLIGGLPAARITDMLTCVGPPDVILMGSPTVLIGNLMAARIGDPTAHGGVIVLGCFTVMIGEAGTPGSTMANAFGLDAAVAGTDAFGIGVPSTGGTAASSTEEYASGVKMNGSTDFRKKTKEALDRLNATPTGKALLKSIGDSKKTVTIVETTVNNGQCRRASDDANKKSDGAPGKGSDSTVSFNPSFTPGGIPNEDVLGHEMIHAQHNAYGQRETGKTGGVKDEELKTVGLPPFPEKGLTENSLREDLKLPKRTSY